MRELRKSDSETNPNILCKGARYPDKILLSQNEEHFNTIVEGNDRGAKIDNAWLDRGVAGLYAILNERSESSEVAPPPTPM